VFLNPFFKESAMLPEETPETPAEGAPASAAEGQTPPADPKPEGEAAA